MSALAGARVVNTRYGRQAAALDAVLIERGARPIPFPCVEFTPPDDPLPFATALASLALGGFDWVAFTSANAVDSTADALEGESIPSSVRIAAVGTATAEAARARLGVETIVVPSVHDAAGLVAVLPLDSGCRVLLPLSSIAGSELANGLRAMGATVTVVSAYDTRIGAGGADLLPMLANHAIDAIAFASPSAVDGFFERIGAPGYRTADVASIPVACIGPTTAERARRHFHSITTSTQQTASGLVDALETALAPLRKGVAACL